MPLSSATDDRVKETSVTTGTGNITLAGAVSQFITFNTAFGLNKRFQYAIYGTTGTEWESGIGYLSGTTTLVREIPSKGSAAVPVSFTAAALEVACSIIGADYNAKISKGKSIAASQSLAMN